MKIFRISLVCLMALLGACSTSLDRGVKDAVQSTPKRLMPTPLALVDDVEQSGSPQSVARRASTLNRAQLVSTSNRPWVGGLQVTRRDDRLPAVFDQVHVLDFGSDQVSLASVAARLSRLTGIPVRVRTDVFEDIGMTTSTMGATDSAPDQAESVPPASAAGMPQVPLRAVAPTGPRQQGDQAQALGRGAMSRAQPTTINAVEMKWNGRLRDFLDHLTNSLSLAWEYQDGAVVIMRLVAETYQMATTPGKQTFSMSSGGSGSGGGSEGGVSMTSQSVTNISTTGVIDVRESILKTVNSLIANVPASFASWSDGSNRIVVATSKENQARVRDYLAKENKYLAQKVNVTFDIYSVRQKDNDEQGVDWSAFFNSLNTRYGIQFASPAQLTGSSAGSMMINTTSRDLSTTNKAVLALLAQYGESVQHRPVSFSASQGVWDTTGRLSTTGYLKETTPGTAGVSGSAGAPGLKTDLITTGDQYSVLPIVQGDNSTLLRFSITLSDLLGLFDVTTGSGETLQKVQTPQIEAITKGSMINLAAGETAVITGLSRRVAQRSENRLSENAPLLAGGSRSASIVNEHLLILVRATPL